MATDKTVLLGHGSGGTMMKRLIDEIFFAGYASEELLQANDASVVSLPSNAVAMSTDSFVVTPHIFPGGDIGRIAVCGTVNDVATSGATPQYLAVSFILEEGFAVEELEKIVHSMKKTADEAGVAIITGDTKVVDKGHGDGVFITTTGIGAVNPDLDLSASHIRPGDVILISGSIGDHGICIISQREDLAFYSDIESDCAPLNKLIANVLEAAPHTRCFRDPTRGGLASTLNEFAESSGVDITVQEHDVPVHDQVRGACEMLGYDVFQVANEGKIVAVVPADEAEAALAAMQASPYGSEAAIIGTVSEPRNPSSPRVYITTAVGSKRVLDMLVGEQLPRIC